MRIYRRIWSGAMVLLGLLFMPTTLLTFPFIAVLGMVTGGLLGGGVVYYAVRAHADPTPDSRKRPGLFTHLLAGAAISIAAFSPADPFGIAPVVLILSLLLLSPRNVGTVSAWWSHPDRATRTLPGPTDRMSRGVAPTARADEPGRNTGPAEDCAPCLDWPVKMTTVSDSELCLAWRASYLALNREVDPGRRRCLITHRGRLLDELERRNPAGFARWLHEGARPASDPTRYLQGDG